VIPPLAVVAVLAAAVLSVETQGTRAERKGAPAGTTVFAMDEGAVPDDPFLLGQLEKAIDLRRREDFDRTNDARDPGELVQHATLSEAALNRGTLSIEALFIVGDELFAYLFRPENGWGRGGADRTAIDYTPELRRVHAGPAGGPDAFACANCHSKGGPDGAGTNTQNAFLLGNGEGVVGAHQRNPPHLLGLGAIDCLAREMSADLQAQAAGARERAKTERHPIEQELLTKGVSFGWIVARPDGQLDTRRVEGVDADLIVRPFGWKGHQSTLRDMAEESLHIHQGLLSNRIQLAVGDGSLARDAYGQGRWDDVDQDGISLEIHAGMLTTVVGYLAQLEAPVVRPPRDPGLVDAWAAGRATFADVGCAKCHVPTLELDDTKLDARRPAAPELPGFVIDVAKDGDGPKIEPKYAGASKTPYLVNLFSDLKRHDMGAALASPGPQGEIPARMFLTRPLWGLAETAPYLHDGRAPTIHDSIVLHDGEAAAARDAYLGLGEGERAGVRVFLTSLSRAPKLFVP
jgi:mono/diheme cytochrome c family protein